MKEKYIIRRWTTHFKEERARTLREAWRIKKRLQIEEPGYCQIFKRSFEKRHPNFPIWFSLITLFLVIFASEVEWCIHHILQIMQVWI